MAFTISAAGIAPFMQLQSAKVFKGAYAGKKLTPAGYLSMLLKAPRPNIISKGVDDGSGHIRNVSVYALQRAATGTTTTSDDCSIDAQPTRIEFTIPTTLFRKKSFFLDDRQVSAYMNDASAWVKKPDGTGDFPGFMQEMWDIMIAQANALIGDINMDLLTVQAAAFGVNAPYSTNAFQTVNFPIDATRFNLTAGMTMLESDAMKNEFDVNNACIVGGGIINNYMIASKRGAIGAAYNGLNVSQLALPNFFYDPYAAAKWGNPNALGVFDADSVQLLQINRYEGSFGGDKGISWFGTIMLPIRDSLGSDTISGIKFDVQIKYIDCPTTVDIAGAPVSVNRGWQVILSKAFNQVNVPSNSYTAADILYGNNGTLGYIATNA